MIEFDHNIATEQQIRNYVTNTLWPDIKAEAQTKIQSNFQNFSIDAKLNVHDIGNNRFVVYPKFWISGETDLTKAQLKTGFKNFMLDDVRPLVRDGLISQGASNIKCYVAIPEEFAYDCNGNRILDDDG